MKPWARVRSSNAILPRVWAIDETLMTRAGAALDDAAGDRLWAETAKLAGL